jgi:hypothetical protein
MVSSVTVAGAVAAASSPPFRAFDSDDVTEAETDIWASGAMAAVSGVIADMTRMERTTSRERRRGRFVFFTFSFFLLRLGAGTSIAGLVPRAAAAAEDATHLFLMACE